MISERQTYSLLEYLGDLGGLFDALRYIASLILGPLTAIALKLSLFETFIVQLIPDQVLLDRRFAKV